LHRDPVGLPVQVDEEISDNSKICWDVFPASTPFVGLHFILRQLETKRMHVLLHQR
jgi:hypothetical protein